MRDYMGYNRSLDSQNYDNAPRAKLFKTLNGGVKDLRSYTQLLRYTNTTCFDAAISSRFNFQIF